MELYEIGGLLYEMKNAAKMPVFIMLKNIIVKNRTHLFSEKVNKQKRREIFVAEKRAAVQQPRRPFLFGISAREWSGCLNAGEDNSLRESVLSLWMRLE